MRIMADSGQKSSASAALSPSSSTASPGALCNNCQVILAAKIQKAAPSLRPAPTEYGDPGAVNPCVRSWCDYRNLSQFYPRRHTCWFCARIWLWLRVLAEPEEGRLSTDDEVLTGSESCWGLVEPNELEFGWSIYHGKWENASEVFNHIDVRVVKHITDRGHGPSFQVLEKHEITPEVLATIPKRNRYNLVGDITDYEESLDDDDDPRAKAWLEQPTQSDNDTNFKESGYSSGSGGGMDWEVVSMRGEELESSLNAPETIMGERLEKIHGWLLNCDKNPDCCGASNSNFYTPTRLIEVGASDDETHLIESASMPGIESVRLKYATLSHCWGVSKNFMLTVSNYNQLLKRIPVSELKPTFREAIALCRRLGITHLWIDNLCILQDSADDVDWIGESSQMHKVYGGSYLNFAASSSINSEQGLFRPFNPLLFEDIGITLPDGRMIRESGQRGRRELFATVWRLAPLYARGWVMQELFLAPRNLHFTDLQAYWECKCGRFAETTTGIAGGTESDKKVAAASSTQTPAVVLAGRAESEQLLSAGQFWHSLSPLNQMKGGAPCAAVADVDNLWCRIARHYSDSAVTFDRDKLIALSGLAALFHQKYMDGGIQNAIYLAGCWSHALPFWLSFKLQRLRKKTDRINGLPSWSWLSAGRQVEFRPAWLAIGGEKLEASGDRIELATVTAGLMKSSVLDLNFKYSLANPSVPYGALKHAKISGRAHLFGIQLNEMCCSDQISSAYFTTDPDGYGLPCDDSKEKDHTGCHQHGSPDTDNPEEQLRAEDSRWNGEAHFFRGCVWHNGPDESVGLSVWLDEAPAHEMYFQAASRNIKSRCSALLLSSAMDDKTGKTTHYALLVEHVPSSPLAPSTEMVEDHKNCEDDMQLDTNDGAKSSTVASVATPSTTTEISERLTLRRRGLLQWTTTPSFLEHGLLWSRHTRRPQVATGNIEADEREEHSEEELATDKDDDDDDDGDSAGSVLKRLKLRQRHQNQASKEKKVRKTSVEKRQEREKRAALAQKRRLRVHEIITGVGAEKRAFVLV